MKRSLLTYSLMAMIAALILVSRAMAQTADDNLAKCKGRAPEIVIDGCTAVINSTEESTSDIAAAFNNRGVAYARVGKFDKAIADFDEAIGLKANYLDMVEDSALSLVESDSEDPGILGDGGTERGPDDALFYKNRGVANYRYGKYSRAVEDFTEALALRKNYNEALLDRGMAYADSGKYDLALEDYDRAIELNPKNAVAFLDRGALYARRDKFDLALKDFDAAIKLRPDYASAFGNRCFARAILGQMQQGLEDCNVALDMSPGSAMALESRGFTYLKLGQYEAARADYSAAVKLAERDPNALYGRALAEQMVGDGAGAENDLAAAKKIDAGIEDEFSRWGISAMRGSAASGQNKPGAVEANKEAPASQ